MMSSLRDRVSVRSKATSALRSLARSRPKAGFAGVSLYTLFVLPLVGCSLNVEAVESSTFSKRNCLMDHTTHGNFLYEKASSLLRNEEPQALTAQGTYKLPPIQICGIDGYDYFNLTAKTWEIDLQNSSCLPMKGNYTDPPSTCRLFVAFCRPLSAQFGCHPNASVCQTSDQGSLTVGGYGQDVFFDKGISVSVPSSTTDGFSAGFPNGGNYTTREEKQCILQTELDFVCNENAKWQVDGFSTDIEVAPNFQSVLYSDSSCKLTLQFDYSGACKRQTTSSSGLSPGTMLLTIFSVSLILYFTLGCMLNISRGRSGSEIVPHSTFWTLLPVYIMDGFLFTASCGRLPVTKTYEEI